MATLADLAAVYAPPPPAGFALANIELARQQAGANAAIGRERTLRNFGFAQTDAGTARDRVQRNFSKFDLPDLISGQAARGALHSSATARKRDRLQTGMNDSLADIGLGLERQRIGAGDQLADIETGLAQTNARLAAQGLLAQTGIQL